MKLRKNDDVKTQSIDMVAVQQQLERLGKYKEERNNDEVKTSLTSLKDTANSEENLIPYIIQAVKSHATLGEISDTLRNTFGEY